MTLAPLYPTFRSFMEEFAIPRKQANSGTLRLDGLVSGPTLFRPIARFKHAERTWDVDGDTQFEPLEIAYLATQREPSRDPFDLGRTRTRAKLLLRPDLKAEHNSRHSYLYVYSEPGWVSRSPGLVVSSPHGWERTAA